MAPGSAGGCRARRPAGGMHIVLIGWLYVIGMVALTAETVARGVVVFALLGLAPAFGVLWLAARRHRARLRGRTGAGR